MAKVWKHLHTQEQGARSCFLLRLIPSCAHSKTKAQTYNQSHWFCKSTVTLDGIRKPPSTEESEEKWNQTLIKDRVRRLIFVLLNAEPRCLHSIPLNQQKEKLSEAGNGLNGEKKSFQSEC